MKNKEFYKNKIYDAACKYKDLAVDKNTGELRDCLDTLCKDCALFDHRRKNGSSCTGAWRRWLEQEHVEPLLTNEEKNYLENVVRPFKDRVKSIQKTNIVQRAYTAIRICVYLYNDTKYTDFFTLPFFDGAKMYTGLEKNKCYTLEELGLFADEERAHEE